MSFHQEFGDCIVCSTEIMEYDVDKTIDYKVPLGGSSSESVQSLLFDLSKILKMSPSIFQGIDLSLLSYPVYCFSCRNIVLNCLEILHQIQCLESNMGDLISILKGSIIQSYNNCNKTTTTTVSKVESGNIDKLQNKEEWIKDLSSNAVSIKHQIRKTFAQCWTNCQVKIDFPQELSISQNTMKSVGQNNNNKSKPKRFCSTNSKTKNNNNKNTKTTNLVKVLPKREVRIKKEEAFDHNIDVEVDDTSDPFSPPASDRTNSNLPSDSCIEETKIIPNTSNDNDVDKDGTLLNLLNRRSTRKRNLKHNNDVIEIILDESDIEDNNDYGDDISDSGSVYIPDSGSGPASPTSLSLLPKSRKQQEKVEEIDDEDEESENESENEELEANSSKSKSNKPKKKWMNGNGAEYQRQYRKQKKLNKHQKLKYICSLCGASYNFLRSLKIHENRHIDDAYFQCIFCNELFYTEDKLCSHEVQSHEFLLEDPSAYNIKGGILESYKCRYCKTNYEVSNYYCSADTGTGDQAVRIKCDIEGCNDSFTSFRAFQLHHDNTCLSIPDPAPTQKSSEPKQRQTETESERADVVDIDIAAARRKFMISALRKLAELPITDCPRYANGRKKHSKSKEERKLLNQSRSRYKRANKDFKYECHICGKGYNQSQHYNGHMKSHQGGITAECDICGERFISEVSLRMHKSKTHINCIRTYSDSGVLASFKCSFCNKEYIKNDILVIGDDGVPIIKCDIGGCTSIFSSNHFLQFSRHHQKSCDMKPQQPLKLFQCQFCDKVFGSQTNLENHTISMHTKEYPYYCDECGRGKVSLGQLNRHKQLVHSGMLYECDKCQQKFKKKELYTIHMRRHNNDLRHMCGQCGKRFLTARHLKFHETTHMDDSDRKFPCRICGKLFKAPHYVRKHIWSTHKKGGKNNKANEKDSRQRQHQEATSNSGRRRRKTEQTEEQEDEFNILRNDNDSDLGHSDQADQGSQSHSWNGPDHGHEPGRAVDLSAQEQDMNALNLQDSARIFGLHFPPF